MGKKTGGGGVIGGREETSEREEKSFGLFVEETTRRRRTLLFRLPETDPPVASTFPGRRAPVVRVGADRGKPRGRGTRVEVGAASERRARGVT